MFVVLKLNEVNPVGITNEYQISSSAVPVQPIDDCDELKVLNVALLQPPVVNVPILTAPAQLSFAGGNVKHKVKFDVTPELKV